MAGPQGTAHLKAFFRGHLYLWAGVVVLLFGAVDPLVAEHWSQRLLVTRGAWAATLAVVSLLLRSTRGKPLHVALGLLAGVATPIFQALIASQSGPVGNPMYGWMIAIPIASVLIGQDELWGALAAGVSSVGSTCLLIALSGAPLRTVLAWGLVVLGASGHACVASIAMRRRRRAQQADSRARKEAEDRLAESEDLRGQAERLAMIGRLASGVAHEINNPLSFVTGNLEALEEDANGRRLPKEELDGIFADVHEGTRRIARIVKSLQTFSGNDREDDGHRGHCLVGEVLAECVGMTQVRLKEGVDVSTEIETLLPEVAVGRQRLGQALLHLLFNAADAVGDPAAQHPGQIRVRAARRDRGVEIAVEDNGPGLAGPALERLFEPFFTTKGPGGGTGLGLAVSRQELQRCGATLEGGNRQGGGGRFVLWLPEGAPGP